MADHLELPYEIWYETLLNNDLNFKDLINLCKTSKLHERLCFDKILWSVKYRKEGGEESLIRDYDEEYSPMILYKYLTSIDNKNIKFSALKDLEDILLYLVVENKYDELYELLVYYDDIDEDIVDRISERIGFLGRTDLWNKIHSESGAELPFFNVDKALIGSVTNNQIEFVENLLNYNHGFRPSEESIIMGEDMAYSFERIEIAEMLQWAF